MVCGKERSGTDLREDYVLRAMRWFKENVTRNAKGYRIVVCGECMPEYRKLRSKFVRRRAMYVGLGILFTLTLVAFSGGRYAGRHRLRCRDNALPVRPVAGQLRPGAGGGGGAVRRA